MMRRRVERGGGTDEPGLFEVVKGRKRSATGHSAIREGEKGDGRWLLSGKRKEQKGRV